MLKSRVSSALSILARWFCRRSELADQSVLAQADTIAMNVRSQTQSRNRARNEIFPRLDANDFWRVNFMNAGSRADRGWSDSRREICGP
jgi:hypothetical protein